MSGTLSRTATARSRDPVGRKLKAKPRPEEHEVHTRRRHGGRGVVGIRSPMTSGPDGVDATGMRGRSRVLPWEICPFIQGKEMEIAVLGRTGQQRPGLLRAHNPEIGTNKSCNVPWTRATAAAKSPEERAEVSRGHTSRMQAAKGQTRRISWTRSFRCTWGHSPRKTNPGVTERQVAEPPMAQLRVPKARGIQRKARNRKDAN